MDTHQIAVSKEPLATGELAERDSARVTGIEPEPIK
jgi:hypothetical protein